MEPIKDKNTKILILGTYPGTETIEKGEYYSNKGNQFWNLLEIDRRLDYKEKIKILKQKRIGIWDMFKSVKRNGALDRNIRSGKLNDFRRIKEECKNLRLVVLNGSTVLKRCKIIAGKKELEKCLEALKNAKRIELYSSSGAANGKMEERKNEWDKIFNK